MTSRILVTGGFGFIGSALLARLLPTARVTAYDNGHRKSPEFERWKAHPNLSIVEGDILDPAALRSAIADADAVIHLAAVAGVTNYYKMPLRTMEVNLLGTRNVLEAARQSPRLRRFVNFATSEIFGPEARDVSEASPTQQGDVAEPRWVYAISKLAAEKMAFAYHAQHGLPVTSLRPFNVYGPGQVGEGAVQVFIRRCLNGEPLEVTGDGLQTRAWCYIDDMCDATMAALERPEAIGRAYNVGDPSAALTILELAEKVKRLTGAQSEIRKVAHIGADVRHRIPVIDRARRELDFVPRVPLDEGLRRTIAWYRSTGFRGEDPRAAASGAA